MSNEYVNDVDVPLYKRASSRRFILAIIFSIGGTVGLFNEKISSEHYYWLAGAVLGGYAATEVSKRRTNQ